MELNTAAQVALYICLFFVLIFAIVTVVLLAGLVLGLNKLNLKIDQAMEAAKPLIAKSTDILDTAQRVTMNVGERADTILERAEVLTESVSRKVDHTASVVEKTVTSPLINVSSVFAGVTRGLNAFNKGMNNGSSKSNGNGTNH